MEEHLISKKVKALHCGITIHLISTLLFYFQDKPIHDSRRRDSSSDSEANDKFANSCDDCNWSGSTKSDPLSFTIEECIEEVVTRYSSEDERDTGLSKFLSTLDFKRRQRAPFPEFGMDIVDSEFNLNIQLFIYIIVSGSYKIQKSFKHRINIPNSQ
ncbi:uncharacterized protein LOC120349635 [Nilaparvata lugens]|uniref:uncharacterized protein LOC120349635 n=1 Tax=Nilaparvata lugens TaxID=108931 RepID=UPI00193CB5CD|nr:uncharacterized protein LOC120349635 [Nilaparvata lugens]